MPKHRKQNILFLYLKSGGGHLSAARALVNSVSKHFSDSITPHLLNPIPETAVFTNFLLQRGYRLSSNALRGIWILLYEISKLRAVDYVWSFITYSAAKKHLIRYLQEHEIGTIVILHFLLTRPVKWALKRYTGSRAGAAGVQYRLLRIVTDPHTAHHAWFRKPQVKTVVFSERLKKLALERFRFQPRNVCVLPPVLGEQFTAAAQERNRTSAKERLGLQREKKTVLFVGGGEGLPGGIRFLKSLIESDLDLQILFVCGKDRRLRRRAEEYKRRLPPEKLSVFGFVDFMHTCMTASDAVVCKAGPAVIRESLATGSPVIIVRYLYGQERGNMEYVIRNGLGYYTPKPKEMVAKLREAVSGSAGWEQTVLRVKNWKAEDGTDRIIEKCLLP